MFVFGINKFFAHKLKNFHLLNFYFNKRQVFKAKIIKFLYSQTLLKPTNFIRTLSQLWIIEFEMCYNLAANIFDWKFRNFSCSSNEHQQNKKHKLNDVNGKHLSLLDFHIIKRKQKELSHVVICVLWLNLFNYLNICFMKHDDKQQIHFLCCGKLMISWNKLCKYYKSLCKINLNWA